MLPCCTSCWTDERSRWRVHITEHHRSPAGLCPGLGRSSVRQAGGRQPPAGQSKHRHIAAAAHVLVCVLRVRLSVLSAAHPYAFQLCNTQLLPLLYPRVCLHTAPHTCSVISAARLNVPSTPLTPKQSTTFCVMRKGTRSGTSSTSPRSNRHPKSTCTVSPAHNTPRAHAAGQAAGDKLKLPLEGLCETHKCDINPDRCDATPLNWAGCARHVWTAALAQSPACACLQNPTSWQQWHEAFKLSPVRPSIMMFSPCLSPRPNTWPTMAQAALVRVKAKRAASQVPSSARQQTDRDSAGKKHGHADSQSIDREQGRGNMARLAAHQTTPTL